MKRIDYGVFRLGLGVLFPMWLVIVVPNAIGITNWKPEYAELMNFVVLSITALVALFAFGSAYACFHNAWIEWKKSK